MSRNERKGSAYIIVAALLWSTGGLLIKSVTLDGFGVSLWRSTFSAMTLYIIYRRTFANDRSQHSTQWFSKRTIVTAFVYAALLVLFVLATKLTTSANAIFLQYTAPVYVLFVEPIISKTKLHTSDIVSVAITIAAMALFFIGKFDTSSVLGNIFALTSGICFAAYALLLKHESTSELMRWQSVILGHLIIVALMLILWILRVTSPIPSNAAQGAELIYLGVFQIGVAYALFTTGIHYIRALDAMLLSMIEPVLNPVWVYLGIGESPTRYAIAGGLVILAVSAYRTWRTNRIQPLKEAR
ncbi:MAG TPA: DMT family transporter [Candidatus Kapabacteria bacterium]|nr:DMT family transporter [Candidatus Kapabacteria bacterium]